NFSVATDAGDTWDGANPSIIATVANSPANPDRYSRGGTFSASVAVTDDDTLTLAMGGDPMDVREGGVLGFTVRVLSGTPGVNVPLAYTVTGTATSGDDFTALSGNVTLNLGTSSASIPVTTLVDTETDTPETVIITLTDPGLTRVSLGNMTSATGNIIGDGSLDNPILSVSGGSAVTEGQDTTFTITAAGRPTNDLTVELAATNVGIGEFLGDNPPTLVTLANTANSWTVTVPTKDSTAGSGGIVGNGSVRLTLVDGDGYAVPADPTATAVVRDIPTITIDYVGEASGTKVCANGRDDVNNPNAGPKEGVCEGDTIIYTLTATPRIVGTLVVRVGTLSARGGAPYGLDAATIGGDYIAVNPSGGYDLSIPNGSSTVTLERETVNRYGQDNTGGMYVEVVCPESNTNCLGAGVNTATYKYEAVDRGQNNAPTAAGNTSICNNQRQAMSDGNESSECLVDIHSVTPPAMSIAAADSTVTSVTAGWDAIFEITGTAVPNHYASGAYAALPVAVTVEQGGAALAGAPTTVNMPVGASATYFTITAGATSVGTSLEATVAASTADPAPYTVGTASVTLTVEAMAAEDSATPVVDLDAASDSGDSDSDDITNVTEPSFTLSDLIVGAEVVVEAIGPPGTYGVRKTFASVAAVTQTVVFGSPGTGGNCDVLVRDTRAVGFADQATCGLGAVGTNDGDWTVIVTQTETGDNPASATLTVTRDSVGPTVTLVSDDNDNAIGLGATTGITATLSEAATTDLVVGDITVSSGALSDFLKTAGSSDLEYTATFTAASSAGMATIGVAADAFTDVAGNGNTAADLEITVEAAAQPLLTIDFIGLTNQSKECAASTRPANQGGRSGICEGDAIVYIITADTAPRSNIVVGLGGLEAGNLILSSGPHTGNRLDYDLPGTPYAGYVDAPEERGGRSVILPMGQTEVRYTIATNNRYGNDTIGAMYVEIVNSANNEYRFNALDRGQFDAITAVGQTSNCSTRQAGGDGNENSECLVDIHPVARPVISVAAVSTPPIAEGDPAVFSITADRAPNHYNAPRTTMIPLPIALNIGEVGDITLNTGPITVNLPAAGGTVNFTVATSPADTDWDGANPAVTATVAASSHNPVRYTPDGAANTASVAVTGSGAVTVEMGADQSASEGGTLLFTVGVTGMDEALDAELVLAYTVTGTATSGSDFTAPSGSVTIGAGTTEANIPVVTLIDNEAGEAAETVIITLTDPALTGVSLGTNTSATGTITEGLAVTLVTENDTINTGDTTVVTIVISETATDFVVGDIQLSGVGMLSGFGEVTGTDNYMVTFTAGDAPGTATLSIAAGVFTNAAGDDNAASNMLVITVESSDTTGPTVNLVTENATINTGDTTVVTIEINEAATGFDQSDITVSGGGTLSGFGEV
ncbi:MAG: beta strand repeat-containing protein, partial [Pseudohongiellaceae bacterium]